LRIADKTAVLGLAEEQLRQRCALGATLWLSDHWRKDNGVV